MLITVWCPHPGCGVEFDVREAARGLHVPCPACHRGVPIGAPGEPPPVPAYVAAPQPLAREPLAPPPLPSPRRRSRARRRRFGRGRRAFGRRGRASGRFGRDEPKSRHGCVTVWLTVVILANIGFALLIGVNQQRISERLPEELLWQIPASIGLCLAAVVCAVALFNWQRWGFIGLCLVSAASAGLDFYSGAWTIQVVAKLLAPVVLGMVLQFGDRRSTWSQLE